MPGYARFYLGKPAIYRFLVPGTGDLDYRRFCYLLIVTADHVPSQAAEVLLPEFSSDQLQTALHSDDPWLVSAALFVIRKQKVDAISRQAVIDRWQKRPDLWDEQCSRQALLLLAQVDAEALGRLQVTNEDVQAEINGLQPIPDGRAYLSPLPFSLSAGTVSLIDVPEINLIELRPAGASGVVVRRWAGDRNQARRWTAVSDRKVDLSQLEYRAIAVRPGSYRLVFNSVTGNPRSGYYGGSTVVTADKGRLIVVPVPVMPAI